MPQRLDYARLTPQGIKAMSGVEHYLNTGTGLEPILLEFVRLRASLLNGCDFCIQMHQAELHKHNETPDRIAGVATWQTSDVYTHRERAALAWAEAITDLHPAHVPDEVFASTREHFTDAELVNLTLAIASINAWNRMGIAFRAEYRKPKPKPEDDNVKVSTGEDPA